MPLVSDGQSIPVKCKGSLSGCATVRAGKISRFRLGELRGILRSRLGKMGLIGQGWGAGYPTVTRVAVGQ